jgi:hypothetical protein
MIIFEKLDAYLLNIDEVSTSICTVRLETYSRVNRMIGQIISLK